MANKDFRNDELRSPGAQKAWDLANIMPSWGVRFLWKLAWKSISFGNLLFFIRFTSAFPHPTWALGSDWCWLVCYNSYLTASVPEGFFYTAALPAADGVGEGSPFKGHFWHFRLRMLLMASACSEGERDPKCELQFLCHSVPWVWSQPAWVECEAI